jgi:general secretion pathway protein J
MSPRGLTLVEVSIAVAILAVMGVMTYGVFHDAYNARDSVVAADQRYQSIRAALSRMTKEISQAYISEHFDRKNLRERPTLFRLDDRGDEDQLLFTTLAHRRLYRDAKESDQAVVEYKVANDPEDASKKVLMRREKTWIDREVDRDGVEAPIAEDVTGLNFEVWDAKDREWDDEWDTSRTDWADRLPPRVKITLKAKDETGRERAYTTQAEIHLTRVLKWIE